MLTPLILMVATGAPVIELRAAVDGAAPKPGWVYVKRGQKVLLHALTRAKVKELRWFKVEATDGAVDNTTPSFHFEPIHFRETELPACAGKLECPADVTPTALPPVEALPGTGTMAFAVRGLTAEGEPLATPSLSSVKWGGLTRDVLRVTVRADDTLVGFASELFNTPYIFGSAGPDGRNQSDLLIGSDCADLIIYARRRMGRAAQYTSSYEIDRQAPEVKKGPPRRGDLVHFPSSRHVAIFYEDRAPLGEVNEDDLILHTCWAPPTVQRLGDSQCASQPTRLLRFPD